MTAESLRRLDTLRDDDPGLAVRRAKAALASAGRTWLPRLLAVYGSARRAQARLEQALEALRYALLLAEGHDERRVCADILQRLGVAHAYTGNHSLGLLFAKQAAYEHRMAGDLRGEGRSWVDQGTRYGQLGQINEAIAAYGAALHSLPEDEVRNRFTAFQSLALAHRRNGNLIAAAQSVRGAEELAPTVGKELAARLIWTKAEIAGGRADHAEAERLYGEALEVYRLVSPIDAALAAVEFARAQVRQGKLDAARETTVAMSSSIQPEGSSDQTCRYRDRDGARHPSGIPLYFRRSDDRRQKPERSCRPGDGSPTSSPSRISGEPATLRLRGPTLTTGPDSWMRSGHL